MAERLQTLHYYFPCFPVLRCGAAMFDFTQCSPFVYGPPATQSGALKYTTESSCCQLKTESLNYIFNFFFEKIMKTVL